MSAMHKLKFHPLSRFSSHRIHFSPHITMRPPLTLPNISSSGLHTAGAASAHITLLKPAHAHAAALITSRRAGRSRCRPHGYGCLMHKLRPHPQRAMALMGSRDIILPSYDRAAIHHSTPDAAALITSRTIGRRRPGGRWPGAESKRDREREQRSWHQAARHKSIRDGGHDVHLFQGRCIIE